VSFEDLVSGAVSEHVDASAGDFVLRRGDGVFAYQFACAVDDAAMAISHVVRGADLLGSTPRQLLLMTLLGSADVPAYAHVPLVVSPDGERLAKRVKAASVRELRARGVPAGEVVEALARGLGLVPPDAAADSPAAVASALTPPATWRKEPWRLPAAWT
jgi:glutamyl-tRNA synthetase